MITHEGFGIEQLLSIAEQTPPEVISATALPYQLTSTALQNPLNVAAWKDAKGHIGAFGLHQTPFQTLFYGVAKQTQADVEVEIFTWGVDRAKDLARESGRAYHFSVWPPETASATQSRLERIGFTRGSRRKVLLQRDLTEVIDKPDVPAGFTVRNLRDSSEAPQAVAMISRAFDGDDTLDVPWRTRIIEHPSYVPELDVVVEDERGLHAASCLCWISRDRQTGQIEPMGTDPRFWRRGLGRAAALEGLRRMQRMGAVRALVGTSHSNTSSRSLYRSIGCVLIAQQIEYTFEASVNG